MVHVSWQNRQSLHTAREKAAGGGGVISYGSRQVGRYQPYGAVAGTLAVTSHMERFELCSSVMCCRHSVACGVRSVLLRVLP